MAKGGKQPGAGRPAGVPNKVTAQAREAIASFVEGNTDRLNRLLDTIEYGIEKDDGEGYIVYPNPKGAFDSIMSVCEYHLPKLNRTDIQPLDKDGNKSDGITKVIIEHVSVKK
jgi:hypothetical protein